MDVEGDLKIYNLANKAITLFFKDWYSSAHLEDFLYELKFNVKKDKQFWFRTPLTYLKRFFL